MTDTQVLAVVRYADDHTTVEIVHDRLRGGELYVTIRRQTSAHAPTIAGELLRDIIAVDHDLTTVGVHTFMVQPDDTTLLRHCIEQLARWTRQFASPLIAGNEGFIRRLGRHRERLAMEQGLAQARQDAKNALNRKDFESVITAYAAFSGSDSHMLGPLDEARLRYARKLTSSDP